MKTKLITLTVLLLSAFAMKAQQGEIIYLDFEPDSLVELKQYDLFPDSKMMIDFDFDSLPDIRITRYVYSGGGWYDMISYEPEWEIHEYEVGDTLMPMNEPEQSWSTRIMWRWYFYNGIDTISDKFAVRHKVEDAYYYGWFRVYITRCPPSPYPWIALDKMAYCTVPDYPLVWGQTSITGIDENENNNHSAIATLYPNPTTGLVTITGDNLQQAELFNMFGQQVLSVQGSGNEMQINVSALPVGVYLVAVTNSEGRRCVRKVVKE